MEENKEFTAESKDLAGETEETNSVDEIAAPIETENTESMTNDEEFNSEELSQPENTKDKKKFPLQVPIIIAAAIVVCVALAFLVLKCFFDTSIVGTWTFEDTATSDEASETSQDDRTYYIFDKDGTVSLACGSIQYMGTYSVTTDDEGAKSVEMYIPTAYLQATFDYSVSGNIFTGRKLELSYEDTESYKFTEVKRVMPELKAADDFKADDALVGDWNYYDGYYDYSYTFNSNGTVHINQNDLLIIDGTYKISDNVVTITFYGGDEYTQDMEYSVDGDELIMQGIQYFKVGSASADEARTAADSSQSE